MVSERVKQRGEGGKKKEEEERFPVKFLAQEDDRVWGLLLVPRRLNTSHFTSHTVI